MLSYRVYCLDAEGRITASDDLDAVDDAGAIELVRLRVEHADCELWCGSRKVALITRVGGAPILFSRPPDREAGAHGSVA
jgi:hypothetical protein